jgi:hypothetical protein
MITGAGAEKLINHFRSKTHKKYYRLKYWDISETASLGATARTSFFDDF